MKIHIGEVRKIWGGTRAILYANITYPKMEVDTETGEKRIVENCGYKLKYTSSARYFRYLTAEKSDAFVVAVLPYALEHGFDIEVETPMSEKLYFQLTEMLLPAMFKHIKEYHPFTIIAPLSSKKLEGKKRVAMSFSGGVDSFYTLLESQKSKAVHYRPEYLVFMKTGSTGSFDGRKMYKVRLARIKAFARKFRYKLLAIDSNISEFLQIKNVRSHTFRSISAILAMQKLIGVFLYSAGYGIDELELTAKASAKYDIFSLPCLSTENLQNYSAGAKAARNEKLQAISDWEPTYDHLDTCLSRRLKDCTCEKCKRTKLGLYSIGKLERYSNVYDIEAFKDGFKDYVAFMLKVSNSKSKVKEMYREIYENFINNGLSLEQYMTPEERGISIDA